MDQKTMILDNNLQLEKLTKSQKNFTTFDNYIPEIEDFKM